MESSEFSDARRGLPSLDRLLSHPAVANAAAFPVRSPLAEALPSGSGRVPLDYKLKRFTRAAHLPPLERHHGWKEIFSAESRAAPSPATPFT